MTVIFDFMEWSTPHLLGLVLYLLSGFTKDIHLCLSLVHRGLVLRSSALSLLENNRSCKVTDFVQTALSLSLSLVLFYGFLSADKMAASKPSPLSDLIDESVDELLCMPIPTSFAIFLFSLTQLFCSTAPVVPVIYFLMKFH
mmetsp:Transcript_31638/g.35961  ORF Transcript_31638/g.35961 Transcript_31638/m.35961 type:complete len:142 (+) Transcript_31638:1212-1637(+)